MAPYIDTDRIKTKNEICHLVAEGTRRFFDDMRLSCTAQHICDELFISRSLASFYLNHLVKEKELIKIISRPVYFLHKKTIEDHYSIRIKENEFNDVDEFKEILRFKTPKSNDFAKMIGYQSSLSYCINECIMALNYPPAGLAILLLGAKGVGKRLLGQCMYEYALNKEIITKDTAFFLYDCAKDKPAVLKKRLADPASLFLYVDHVELLQPALYKLFELYFRESAFSSDQKKAPAAMVRVMFATTCKREELARELLSLIPIHAQLPNLEERPLSEKQALIALFLKQEANKLKKDIKISDRALNTLLEYPYAENIKQLREVIRISCANAMIKGMHSDTILFYRYNLPDYIISSLRINDVMQQEETNYIAIDDMQSDLSGDYYGLFEENVITAYQQYTQQKWNIDELLSELKKETNRYFDYLIFENKYINSKIETLESVVLKITGNISDTYGVYLSANFSLVLTRIVYAASLTFSVLESRKKQSELQNLLQVLERYYHSELSITKEIANLISAMLDITIDTIHLIGITIYIKLYSRSIPTNHTSGIIISHGYSTASSIADACNRLLGKKVFDAIDMPLDMQVISVVSIIKKYITKMNAISNAILLVDMGSLESIGNYLKDIPNLNIGVINNISTRIALSVGNKIMQEKSLHNILDETCREASTSYVIIKNKTKQKIIVFSADNGLTATKRLADLFFKSLPKEANINLLCHDFHSFSNNPENDPIFEEYDVILIIGSINMNVTDIPFVSLEDIIILENMNLIKSVLAKYLDEAEIQEFDDNLLNHFSLENIVGYLTILNPEKVLRAVESGIQNLQKRMNTEFSSKTKIGLNIHICCLIEGLVTKDRVEKPVNEPLSEALTTFINHFKISFNDLEMQYRIEIPTNEVLYVYHYIQENEI